MSTLLPPIGARELAPRRPLCKRPRPKRQKLVLVLRRERVDDDTPYPSYEEYEWAYEPLQRMKDAFYDVRLTATEKLMLFYITVVAKKKYGDAYPQWFPVDDFSIHAACYLNISINAARKALDGLHNKGVVDTSRFGYESERWEREQQMALQAQEEKQNG